METAPPVSAVSAVSAVSTGSLLQTVFAMEFERLAALLSMNEGGDPTRLPDVDAALGQALDELEDRGAAYPLHMLAQRYRLSQPEYILLLLALTPWGPAELGAEILAALGAGGTTTIAPAAACRLMNIIGQPYPDWDAARLGLADAPLLVERLLLEVEVDTGAGGRLLVPSAAVLELLGLS